MESKEIFLQIRKEHNLTQDEMAARLFVTPQAVSRWECGETLPNIDTLKVISKEFGVSIDAVFGSERNKLCQCCTSPLNDLAEFGTERDGTLSTDYCIYCYKDGDWVAPNQTVEDIVKYTVPYMVSPSMSEDEARKTLNEWVPTLKRWKKQ